MFRPTTRIAYSIALALSLCLPFSTGAYAEPSTPVGEGNFDQSPSDEQQSPGDEQQSPTDDLEQATEQPEEQRNEGEPGTNLESAVHNPDAEAADSLLPLADPLLPPGEGVAVSGPQITRVGLNLRSGPTRSASVLKVLPTGSPLSPTGEIAGVWQEVTSRGLRGWVDATFLSPAPGVLATSTGVHLRSGAGSGFTSLTVLAKGEPVRPLGEINGAWWRVAGAGLTGWVNISYLGTVSPAPLLTSAAVNLRSGPSATTASLRVLRASSPLTSTGEVNGVWLRVRAGASQGWVHSAYLRVAPTSGWYTSTNLNVRSGPSTANTRLTTLPLGTLVNLTGSSNGRWWRVKSGSTTGWVRHDYLTRTRPTLPTPDCRQAKCIALTFDDGPGPDTARLLNILAEQRVPATFFLMGQRVSARSGVVARMAREGHEIGNHTWSHPSLVTLTDANVREQVRRADSAIHAATGRTPTLLRPPYGARNQRVDSLVGKPIILWDVDTRDWEHKRPAQTIAITLRDARRGSIVLMHDVHSTTVDAVPTLITRLRSQGYQFVTISQLFAGKRLQPGQFYYRAV